VPTNGAGTEKCVRRQESSSSLQALKRWGFSSTSRGTRRAHPTAWLNPRGEGLSGDGDNGKGCTKHGKGDDLRADTIYVPAGKQAACWQASSVQLKSDVQDQLTFMIQATISPGSMAPTQTSQKNVASSAGSCFLCFAVMCCAMLWPLQSPHGAHHIQRRILQKPPTRNMMNMRLPLRIE